MSSAVTKIASGGGTTVVRLSHFNIGSHALHPEHAPFLKSEVVPVLDAGGSILLMGMASRSGSAAANKALSQRRNDEVLKILRSLTTTNFKVAQNVAVGEDRAAQANVADGTEDASWRAVQIVYHANPEPPPPPSSAPSVTKVIEVTAKSFIAFIGSKTGVMPGWTAVPLPVPPFIPHPVQRQLLLEALAKVTDGLMTEDPRHPGKDKHYRLFSRVRFEVIFANGKILAANPTLDTDTGKESQLQAPPLITEPVTVGPLGGSVVKFSWFGKGKPNPAAELGFQAVKLRTSVYIWHIVEGQIDVSSGAPITTVGIRGSQFPSHRVFVDNRPVPRYLQQGPFSNLWNPAPDDLFKVR